MARKHQMISNPVSGETVEFIQTHADTEGALLEWVHVLAPGRRVPLDHIHTTQDETFEVLSGVATVLLRDRTLVLTEGHTLAVPKGTAHGVRNEGHSELRIRTELRPARRTEEYLETVFGLARDGKVNRKGVPGLLRLSVIARGLEERGGVAGMPIVITDAATAMAAPIGRLLGFRATYREYTDVDA